MDPSAKWEDLFAQWERRDKQRKQRQAALREKERALQGLSPLPRRVAPLPGEDLASLLARTARALGYPRPEWLLHPEQINHTIPRASLSLLRRRADYTFLGRLLLLEEEHLYALTLHRFAERFQPPLHTPPVRPAVSAEPGSDIERLLLPYEHRTLFQTERHTSVCPHCLDEGVGYDRLFWRCHLLFLCPRHALFLVNRCPACHALIPALRPSLTTCPICRVGDYRRASVPLQPEEQWCVPSHRWLLAQLGIEVAETELPRREGRTTGLERLPSQDYLHLLSSCFSILQPSFFVDERALRFFMNALGLEALITRRLEVTSFSLFALVSSVLAHYLLDAWPVHFLVFLDRLQRLLQDIYHYAPESAVVLKWAQALVRENVWCLAAYRQQPVVQVHAFFNVYTPTFEHLLPEEKAEAQYGGVAARDRIVVEEIQASTESETVAPYPWESLPSLLARAAHKRGYRWSEKIYQATSDVRRHRLFPTELPLLHRRNDYQFLAPLLGLDEASLYTLTLHRLAHLQAPLSQDPAAARPFHEEIIDRHLLREETAERYCLPGDVTKVCPACLEEQQYEWLYWNVHLILLCPRHQILLVDRCPRCVRMIPALRRTVLTECPYCRRGDYRAAACLRIAPDTLLSQGQHVLLQMLGVEEFGSEEIPTRTLAAPLATLKPWQYMDLLDSFGSVVPFLRPERALAACNRKLGFPPPPLARASPGDRRRMVHVSLFQALLLSWPGQGD